MSESWKKLSVVLVGCGSIGKRHARILTALGIGKLHAFDTDKGQQEALIAESPGVQGLESLDEGLAKRPDAVFILTPPKLHIPQARAAVEAGCHVFLEKPLSDSLDGTDHLAELAKRSGRKAMVGLCFRYHQGLKEARRLLDSGAIGRLVSVRALFGEHLPEVRPDYRNLFSAKYLGAYDLMHDVDLAIWFADQPVRNISALHGTYSDIGIEAPDVVEILLGFKDRCMASIHLDFFQRPRRRQIDLIGTEGVILVEFASWDRYTLSVYTVTKAAWETRTEPTMRDDMFRAEDLEFLQAIAEDRPIACGIGEAAKSLSVIMEAQKQSRRALLNE